MKLLKRLKLILITSLAITLTTPYIVPAVQTYAADEVKINNANPTCTVGKKIKLRLSNNKAKIKWTSKDTSIAKVDSKGVVTPISSGTTVVTATVGKKKYTSTIKVSPVTFNSKLHYLCLEEQLKLETRKNEADVKWESEDSTVATVSEDGTITGKSVGKTVINAVINGVKYPYGITVEDPKIVESYYVDAYQKVSYSELLSGTERKDIWWDTSDPHSVKDNLDGNFSGHIRGESILTAHFGSGSEGKTLSCIVICTGKVYQGN